MEFTGERLVIEEKNEHQTLYEEHIARYEYALQFIKFEDRVLDMACGTGYGSALIVGRKEKVEVWGGDISQAAIESARQNYSAESRLHFQVIDAQQILPFEDNWFDVVISFETIEHLKNYRQFVQEIKRVLKPGGKFILSTPNKRATKQLAIKNPFHIKEFDLGELKQLLAGFGKVKFYGQRPLTKMSFGQKVLQQLYIFYRSCKCLHWLDKIISQDIKQKTSQVLDAVEESYKVEPLEIGKEYLFLVAVGEKGDKKF